MNLVSREAGRLRGGMNGPHNDKKPGSLGWDYAAPKGLLALCGDLSPHN